MKGIVVKFDKTRGFGFIRSKQHAEDIFVHITSVRERKTLAPGQRVEFTTKETEKGLSTVDVIPGEMRKSPYVVYGAASVLITLALLAFFSRTQPLLMAYIISVNLTTAVFFGYDKMIAGSNTVRIPELLLHGLAVAGGSPASFFSQLLFRHKTAKGPFQAVYWSIVGAQVLFIIFIMRKV